MSGYGSITESTRVFGETGVPSKPEDARIGCAWFWDPCSLSDSSDCPTRLPADVSRWNGFEEEPVGRGERTEDWSRSSHAITVCRCWLAVDVALRYAQIKRCGEVRIMKLGGERRDGMIKRCAHILLVGCGKAGPAQRENGYAHPSSSSGRGGT